MYLKFIGCKVLQREISHFVAQTDNIIDVTFLRQGLHNTPDKLRETLQNEIDLIDNSECCHTNEVNDEKDFKGIILGYGLCSNGILGLSSKKYPLIIPKAHDCITLFLGSKERYSQCFEELPGTYWYTRSWLENALLPDENIFNRLSKQYKDDGYDDDTIDFLLEYEKSWIKNYNYGVYINLPLFQNQKSIDKTKLIAKTFNWEYKEVEGDLTLVEKLINGQWDENDFLIVPPNSKVSPSYDNNVIKIEEE